VLQVVVAVVLMQVTVVLVVDYNLPAVVVSLVVAVQTQVLQGAQEVQHRHPQVQQVQHYQATQDKLVNRKIL
jgi:hypothetical protein